MGFLSPETFDGAPEENREGRCLPILQRRAVAADAIGALVTSHVIPLCFLLSANFLLLNPFISNFTSPLQRRSGQWKYRVLLAVQCTHSAMIRQEYPQALSTPGPC